MPDKWAQYAVGDNSGAPSQDKWAQYAQPSSDLTQNKVNPATGTGYGLYQMKDQSGKTVGIPYFNVQAAAQKGYSFADDASRQQFNKDYSYATTGPGHEEAFAQSDKNAPLPMQAVSGVVKGIGTVAKPVLDAVGAASGVPQQAIDTSLEAQTPMEMAGKVGTVGAVAAPAAIAAPVATAGATVGGTVAGTGANLIAQGAGASPRTTALVTDAAGLAGGAAGAMAAEPAVNALNYKAKIENAKDLFGVVAKDANKVPVQLDNAQESALKLMDWQKKTQLGPTINKFLNRITNPKEGPLTYKDARDYYQLLGKLSADESAKMNPAVRRDLVQMVVGLKQDIGNAADTVGQASNYYQAMGDMATGKRLESWADFAKKWAIRAGLGGGLAYDVYKHVQ